MAFGVQVPESVDEVVAAMGEGRWLLAGGTSVMPWVNTTAVEVSELISLRRAGLAGVSVSDGVATVGAATTLTQLGRALDFLHGAVASIASPTIRNMATVGGNLFVPSPHGDLMVCLLALGASATVIDADGERTIAVEDVARGPLVTSLRFALPERWYYRKAMRRKQNSASIVTVASDGVRIALGGVAPRPIRARAAEAALAGIVDRKHVEAAAAAALEDVDPPTDAYASAWYRRRVLGVHIRRALLEES